MPRADTCTPVRPSSFFGTVPWIVSDAMLSSLASERLPISGVAPIMAAPCMNRLRLRCKSDFESGIYAKAFSREMDDPCSPTLPACPALPSASYREEIHVQAALRGYR